MTPLEEFTQDMIEEAQADEVGLWLINAGLREEFGLRDSIERRELALIVVEKMLESGRVSSWRLDARRGDRSLWSAPIPEILQEIRSAWDNFGHDPSIGDIVTFLGTRNEGKEKGSG